MDIDMLLTPSQESTHSQSPFLNNYKYIIFKNCIMKKKLYKQKIYSSFEFINIHYIHILIHNLSKEKNNN